MFPVETEVFYEQGIDWDLYLLTWEESKKDIYNIYYLNIKKTNWVKTCRHSDWYIGRYVGYFNSALHVNYNLTIYHIRTMQNKNININWLCHGIIPIWHQYINVSNLIICQYSSSISSFFKALCSPPGLPVRMALQSCQDFTTPSSFTFQWTRLDY